MPNCRTVDDDSVEVAAFDMLLKGKKPGQVGEAGEGGDVIGHGLVHVAPDEHITQPGAERAGRIVAAGHRLQRPEVGRQRLRPLTQGAAEGRGEAGPEAEGERLAAVLSDGSGGGGGQRADAGAAPAGEDDNSHALSPVYGDGEMIAHGKRDRLTPPRPCPRIVPAMPVESETVPVGSQAPDFTLTSIQGEQVKLSDYRGRNVVLIFLRGFG